MRGPSGTERAWQEEAAAAGEGGLPTPAGGVAHALLSRACLQKTWQETRKWHRPGAVICGSQLSGAKGRAGNRSGGTIGTPLASQASLLLDNHDFSDQGYMVARAADLQRHLGRPLPALQSRTPGPNPSPGRCAIDLTTLTTEAGPSLTFHRRSRTGVPCTLVSA